MRLFVFGLGYSSTSAVNHLIETKKGTGAIEWIAATTRSAEKKSMMEDAGLKAYLFDGKGPGDNEMRDCLKAATHILVSIAPGEQDPVLAYHEGDMAEAKFLEWIGYYSTVGVYGHHHGDWVDEQGELRPVSKRSKERVVAEESWQSLADQRGVPLAIMRLAGIYGPGRNAFVNLEAGRARRIVKPGQVFNRIHVEDIGAITAEALKRKASGVFNGADAEPAPPQDVVEYAAKKMGVAVPPDIPYDEADLSPMGRSFYGETKRVANRRIASDLGLKLSHPTYREALDALWNEGTWRDLPLLKKVV